MKMEIKKNMSVCSNCYKLTSCEVLAKSLQIEKEYNIKFIVFECPYYEEHGKNN